MSIKQNMIDSMRGLTIIKAGLNRQSAFDEAVNLCITLVSANLEGMVIVPEIPTNEMIKAANNRVHLVIDDTDIRLVEEIIYEAMLDSLKEQQ